MTPSEREHFIQVALFLIGPLGDPELVLYFLRNFIPIEQAYRRECLTEQAREFHISLRVKPSDRWSKLKELCEGKNYTQVSHNSCIPITCTLPIDGARWRAQKKCMDGLQFFRGSFIRTIANTAGPSQWPPSPDNPTPIREKARLVNYLSRPFEISFMKSVREIYQEYVVFEEDAGEHILDHPLFNEVPHLIYYDGEPETYEFMN